MRLELTKKTDLAFKALTLIAESPDERTNGASLANDLDVSTQYLPHIMAPLTRAGWVTSVSGPNGGYEMATSLRDVSFLDLIQTVEGPVDKSRCLHLGPVHDDNGHCALHDPWTRARSALLDELAATPLSGLLTAS
ncbi:MAG: Rrf2 family transcriptional regulator [Acidimicrobiia bacterium]